jgi:hypothetical protein
MNYLGAVRRQLLTPDMAETQLSVRGFTEKDSVSKAQLERIGSSFLTGYGHAAEARNATDAEARLELIPGEFRGFAYEGAAMAFAVRDGLPLGHRHHVADFLVGPGRPHIYMSYVGIGWALARVPRFRWRAAAAAATNPLLRWLVLDGFGFHQAYFHTAKYVHNMYREPRFPWPFDDRSGYSDRAIDQGIGRAMWFVAGANPDLVVTMIEKFPQSRHADLFGGVGLAATYAGGADESELRRLRDRAGCHWAQIAQGAAFAATARIEADLVTPHTATATGVLCGKTPADADMVCRRTRPADADNRSSVPAYEVWRQRIVDQLTEGGQ